MKAFEARCILAYQDEIASIRARKRIERDAARQAEPFTAWLPVQHVGFLKRHPRYWSSDDLDTYHALRTERLQFESLLRHDATNEGRQSSASLQGFKGTNGSRTMAAARWYGTPRKDRTVAGKVRKGYESSFSTGFECVSIMPDGTRTIMTRPGKDAPARKVEAKIDHAATYAARLARFGADGDQS